MRLRSAREETIERWQRLADRGVEYVLLTNASATPTTLERFVKEIMARVHARRPALDRAANARKQRPAAKTLPIHVAGVPDGRNPVARRP